MKKLLLVVFVFAAFLSNAQNPVLYGLTSGGGAFSEGDIFKITSSGKLTDLHDFGDTTDGQSPFGSLMYASNGLLYGMTQYGGANGFGAIFSYNITTGVESDVHDFNADSNGYEPYSTRFIQIGDSLLYGLTMEGGDYLGGTIFSYNIYTGAYTRLYSFGIPPYQLDGYHPYASLLWANNGLLYGTTQYGGVNNVGVIFSYNVATGTETKLHDFGSGTDGAFPVGTLIQAKNGLLYGTAAGWGTDSAGIIFSFNIIADTESDVYDFKGDTDGYQPYGALVQAGNGLLYGMTSGGGVYDTAMFGGGTIFSYNTLNGTETVLHSFGNDSDGAWPNGSLIQGRDSLLYGMTLLGGADTQGMVFNYNISSGAETVLNKFSGTDGGQPAGDLLEIDSLGPYFPMFGYNHQWYVDAPWEASSPRSSLNDNLPYTFMEATGDITISNNQYYEANISNYDTAYFYDTTFYFRENTATQQVWILTNSGKEKLLYDFSLQKGDSVYLTFDFPYSTYYSTGWYFVDSVETVNIYAGPRKGLFLSSPVNSSNQFGPPELEWIEQIGSTIMPDYLQRDILYYSVSYALLCSYDDGIKIYHNNSFYNFATDDSCSLDHGGGINRVQGNSEQISIYPNPSEGEVTIVSTKNIDELKVFNLLGQMVYTSQPKQAQFDFELNDEGMYFVTVRAGDEITTGKVVVGK